MKFIKKHWHFFFILICSILAVGVSANQYYKAAAANHVQTEISKGHLDKSSLHKNGILILCYHRVLRNDAYDKLAESISNNAQLHEYQISTKTLISEINYLQKHHVRIIPLAEAIKLVTTQTKLHHQYVVLTFDDFDNTVAENVNDVLSKRHIPYTVFVITGKTGYYDGGTALATWSQINTMAKNPDVTFGLHTNNMHYLVDNKGVLTLNANYHTFQKDYHTSQKVLHAYLHRYGHFFAYPYGEYNDRVQRFLVHEGIITFSLVNSVLTPNTDLTQPVGRTMISANTWRDVVQKWVR